MRANKGRHNGQSGRHRGHDNALRETRVAEKRAEFRGIMLYLYD